MRIRLIASLLLLAATSTVVFACSSDDTTPTPGTGTTTPPSTQRVTAAAGGTVTDPSGKVTLNIPPGALAADTDISLTVQPSSNGAATSVYEFGPDGLQFSKPVALEIKADPGGAVPEGKSLALAVLEGTTYKALADSKFDGTKATGSIMHFSHYSLIVVDGKLVLVPPASCDDAYTKFTPCGGSLIGTWTFTDLCIPGLADSTKPTNCPTATAEGDIEITRDVTFDATTLTLGAGSLKISSTINYPLSCTSVTTCAALQDQAFSGIL